MTLRRRKKCRSRLGCQAGLTNSAALASARLIDLLHPSAPLGSRQEFCFPFPHRGRRALVPTRFSLASSTSTD